jgi:hypothetical protein
VGLRANLEARLSLLSFVQNAESRLKFFVVLRDTESVREDKREGGGGGNIDEGEGQ